MPTAVPSWEVVNNQPETSEHSEPEPLAIPPNPPEYDTDDNHKPPTGVDEEDEEDITDITRDYSWFTSMTQPSYLPTDPPPGTYNALFDTNCRCGAVAGLHTGPELHTLPCHLCSQTRPDRLLEAVTGVPLDTDDEVGSMNVLSHSDEEEEGRIGDDDAVHGLSRLSNALHGYPLAPRQQLTLRAWWSRVLDVDEEEEQDYVSEEGPVQEITRLVDADYISFLITERERLISSIQNRILVLEQALEQAVALLPLIPSTPTVAPSSRPSTFTHTSQHTSASPPSTCAQLLSRHLQTQKRRREDHGWCNDDNAATDADTEDDDSDTPDRKRR
ncbi:Nn.00g024400.m01.CDS01 [Neocucurbitaria sp. VM-36]